MRRLATVVATVVATAACSDLGGSVPTGSSVAATTVAETLPEAAVEPTLTTAEQVPGVETDQVPALAVYLAAIDDGLAGTKHEGEAFVDPETFIVTGRLFCELLDQGLEIEAVLQAYAAALGSSGEQVDTDDYLLGGVVLGAAVKLVCPRHGEAIGL